MKRYALVPALLFTLGIATLAVTTAAPLPPLAPNELDSGSDTLVTGTVVESRALFHGMLGASLYYVRLKVKVESVGKGRENIRGAEFIEVRCWHNTRTDTDEPLGHSNIPADGSRFRAYLTQHKEGYFEALEPNGFELLDGSAQRVFPPADPRTIGTWQIIGGIVGVLGIIFAAFLRFRKRGPKDRSWTKPAESEKE